MRLQPNYNNQNYSQFAFKAYISGDDKTKANFKRIINAGGDNPESVYGIKKDLEKIDSEDAVSLDIDDSDKDNVVYTLTNTRTKASLKMRENIDEEINRVTYKFEPQGSLYEEYHSQAGSSLYNAIFCHGGTEQLFDGKGLYTWQLSRYNGNTMNDNSEIKDISNRIDNLKTQAKGEKAAIYRLTTWPEYKNKPESEIKAKRHQEEKDELEGMISTYENLLDAKKLEVALSVIDEIA